MDRMIIFVFSLIAVSCIHASEEVCGPNESSNICGRLCEPTCSNKKPNTLTCPRIACTEQTRGCRCNEGYYRDKETGQCVCSDDCTAPTPPPPTCGENEQLGNCGRICEGTCSNPDLTRCAATSCLGVDCQCKSGYLRNEETDLCVPANNCPKKCCAGEIRAACGKTCEGTCDSPVLPEICTRIRCATQSCRCDLDAGFVRNKETGKCVQINKCPPKKPKCPANSEAKLCGKFCEPTCSNPLERFCKVDPTKCTVDCRCLKGYVRDEKTNECVTLENCSECSN